MDLKSILAQVAPVLGTALGGPFGGVAGQLIARAIVPEQDPSTVTQAQLATAAASLTPDDYVKLQQAEEDFKLKLAQLQLDTQTAADNHDVQMEQIAEADRASARQREATVKDWTPMALAFTITLGFFFILGFMLINGVPAAGGDALMVMLGSLGSAWFSVVGYYFGSSAGSARKTDLMATTSSTAVAVTKTSKAK